MNGIKFNEIIYFIYILFSLVRPLWIWGTVLVGAENRNLEAPPVPDPGG